MHSSRLVCTVSPTVPFFKSPSRMSIQQGLPYNALKALLGHESRSVGAVLGCFCGDALGAPVEGQSWHGIAQQRLNFGQMEYGSYTGDTQMTLALAQSLVRVNKCDAADAARAYVMAFDDTRGYGGSAVATLAALRDGTTDYMHSGTRGFPDGSFANGGAMRIAPVGLAYRNADSSVLQQAVKDALLCTHVHPEGIEGAFIQAAAVAVLSNTPTPDGAASTNEAPGGSPQAVLHHLQSLAQVPVMQDKLQVLLHALPTASQPQPGSLIDGSNWEGDAGSKAWQYDCEGSAHYMPPCSSQDEGTAEGLWLTQLVNTVLNCQPALQAAQLQCNDCSSLSSHALKIELVLERAGVAGFQIRAMDAAVCALWALCRHWQDPKAAVIAAVRGGGDADTTAAMTGALCGALHGCQWIPEQWFDKLENGQDGRDAAVGLALQLASLDIK